MSSFVLFTATGLGLAGLYFLLASGLSLIFGLMNVLNLAHGAFFAIGGYAAWLVMDRFEAAPLGIRFLVAVLAAALVGTVAGAVVGAGSSAASTDGMSNRSFSRSGSGSRWWPCSEAGLVTTRGY